MRRVYGRQYRIVWDQFEGSIRIILGSDTLGFHQTDDGAKALVHAHAKRVTTLGRAVPFQILFGEDAVSVSEYAVPAN